MTRSGSRGSAAPSLPEVHATVRTSHPSLWRRMFAFAGPAYLVSVGYMDPGNWATDLEGGARFGYRLLWVLVMSNAMAILLQSLSARLGIASGRDLAQACRETYPRPINLALWALCEVAIAACDLAEVIGAAIGLKLLFGVPLLAGVILTALDTLLLLWLSRYGIRVIEAMVLSLITAMAGCFLVEIWLVKPVFAEVARGLIPSLDHQSLYVAIAILGATVMPHNLYLHSALVQTRRIGKSSEEKASACRFNLLDSAIALNGALLVNAAILVLAAAAFFKHGIVVTEIQQAHQLLAPLLGTTMAGTLFAIALLCAGQSSTMTGTMAGQIIMEGFLNFRMRPWLRRLITRTLAIIPAAAVILVAGDKGTYQLLIFSQVVLSMQLPFAVIPLIHFTSDRKRMGKLASGIWVRLVAWITALVIVTLNIRLAAETVGEWVQAAGAYRELVVAGVILVASGLLFLLGWVTLQPWLPAWLRKGREALAMPEPIPAAESVAGYRTILVPLDHTDRDQIAMAHAAALARLHGSKVYLVHVEEGVTSQIYGDLSSTAEVEAGQRYLDEMAESLRAQSIEVATEICHSREPKAEIIRIARRIQPDLLVMGAHGHTGLKDLVFGQTIEGVRHAVDAPILIVKNRQS